MNKFIKVLVTILIAIISGLIFMVSIAIAGTSHNISVDSREHAIVRGFVAIVIGIVIIIGIWIPWKKIKKRFNLLNDDV